MVVQGTNDFDDYQVFLRAMSVALSSMGKEDTDFTIYKMKLLHMISMCFDTFYLENIEKEVFIVCGACKSFIERKNLIDQLQHVLDTNDFTLDTTMPEETYAILQFFAYAIHYEK